MARTARPASMRNARLDATDSARDAWWALGDAPVRVADTVVPLVDGRAAMLAMCAAILGAKERVWLADWDMHPRLTIVRGRDLRAGPDGSAEQDALLARLRAAGLDDDAIALWNAGSLRVVDVLGHVARRGVEVRVLLWDPLNPLGRLHITNNAPDNQRQLRAVGVDCRLDKNSRSILHVAQALHQKCCAIDGRLAFIGGVDLTVQCNGDFDRWDTPSHPFEGHSRSSDLGPAPHPWHDTHVLVSGAPALDVEHDIQQRWEDAGRTTVRRVMPPLGHLAAMLLRGEREAGQHAVRRSETGEAPQGAGPEVPGAPARVQVVRTIPALTYRFAPAGIYGIAQAYTLAARRAERFMYLESQYLWLETFSGVDTPRLGRQSHHMRALLTEMAAAAERGVTIALVLPDHPNCGRVFTDATIGWLRQNAPRASVAGRLHFFTLATCAPHATEGHMRYRPIYVHSKATIIDDRWATIGSANLNSRGMSHDAELNLAILDSEFARALRMMLWAEHIGSLTHAHTGWPAPGAVPLPTPLVTGQDIGLVSLVEPLEPWRIARPQQSAEYTPLDSELAALQDPLAGIALLAARAADNLERLRRGEALIGQVLPYLLHEEGAARGLNVDKERGLLDPLRLTREQVDVGHINRYM
jgi:phosphatidylserine/phosphatidylglycerophosphate/cardiolipin synthase-like enzyme